MASGVTKPIEIEQFLVVPGRNLGIDPQPTPATAAARRGWSAPTCPVGAAPFERFAHAPRSTRFRAGGRPARTGTETLRAGKAGAALTSGHHLQRSARSFRLMDCMAVNILKTLQPPLLLHLPRPPHAQATSRTIVSSLVRVAQPASRCDLARITPDGKKHRSAFS